MSDIPTQRQVRTAHKRRARLIAQMHRQAMEAADELLTQHHAIEESLNKIAEHARRRRITAITGALVVALGCIVALGNDVIGENRHSGNSPAAYSDAELGKKNLSFGGVLISNGGRFLCWFDISLRDQATECLFLGCTWIFGPFFYAPTAHDVTQHRKLVVVDGDGLCHLTAPYEPSHVRYN